jgi:hypothetical protein
MGRSARLSWIGQQEVGRFPGPRRGATQAFDAEGTLVDERIRRLLAEFMAGFAAFVSVK